MTLGRVGLIGDVHGEDRALEAALDHLHTLGVERVLCAGDVADGHSEVDRCCRLLGERGVLTVAGNHDRWLLGDQLRDLPDATPRSALSPPSLRFLLSLPRALELSSVAGKMLLCHGLGEDDMVGLRPDHDGYELETNAALGRLLSEQRYRFVLAGHTHQRMARRIGGITFVNAGTLHRDFSPCCTLVDFSAAEVVFIDLDPAGGVLGSERHPLP